MCMIESVYEVEVDVNLYKTLYVFFHTVLPHLAKGARYNLFLK